MVEILDNQLQLDDIDEEYKAFVEKFKPKKTTDDCYTPPNVYEAVLGWAVEEYGINPDNVVRPFWPGEDYKRFDYPEGCVVVDNPPFSIISQICRDYVNANIKFFLFAPYLTNFSSQTKGTTHILVDVGILYENGATVNTAFITNLDKYEIRTAPELRTRIVEADKVNRAKNKRELPKYSYPANVITSTMVGYLSKYGIDFKVRSRDCAFIRQLDSQKAVGKGIFGGGYLLSEKAAAEKAAAEKAAAEKAAAHVWNLSRRELKIIDMLGDGKHDNYTISPDERANT